MKREEVPVLATANGYAMVCFPRARLSAPSARVLLWPGETVIMDNLPSHKVAGVREAIEAAGANLLDLRPIPRT